VCPAGEGFPCPTGHRGCDQARKLLGHYRRCRKSRARQAGQHPSRRDASQQNSTTCLVCSLVARQARSLLETRSSSSLNCSTKSASSQTRSSLSTCSSASSSGTKSRSSVSPTPVKKASGRRIVASFMLDGDNVVMPPPPSPRTSSESEMPPPPSRNGVVGHHSAPLPAPTYVNTTQGRGGGMAPPMPVIPKTTSPDHPLTGAEQHNLGRFYRQGAAAARFRPRSASVGDSSLLFQHHKTSLTTSSVAPLGCEPICEEEEPVTNNNGRVEDSSSTSASAAASTTALTLDGLAYNHNNNKSF